MCINFRGFNFCGEGEVVQVLSNWCVRVPAVVSGVNHQMLIFLDRIASCPPTLL